MSRISRTRSAAAGIEAPATSSGLNSEPLGNAAAAAKTRHSGNRQVQQEAKSQKQQPPVMPVDHPEQQSSDNLQADVQHQGSIDENDWAAQPEKASEQILPTATGNSHQLLPDSHAARTRSLPPRPKPARTRSAKPPLTKPVQSAAPAEHAVPAEPAVPSVNPLSSTLAGIAQSLVAFGSNLHNAPPDADEAPEQIDMDFHFSNESDDSDFQPDREPAQADDEVIDLSQEDPVDVVEHPDGSVAIRSPLQAAAVAAVEADANDDEEEFQQLQGQGKRRQTKQVSTGGTCAPGTVLRTPVTVLHTLFLSYTPGHCLLHTPVTVTNTPVLQHYI